MSKVDVGKLNQEYIVGYKKRNMKLKSCAAIIGMSLALAGVALPVVGVETASAATISNSQAEFLSTLAPTAKKLASENNLYASVMIAQAILESGWGTSDLGTVPNYNLFGIKGTYNGETAVMPTLEDNGDGTYFEIIAGFKKYPSYAESLQDYVSLIKNGTTWNKNIYSGVWLSNTTSYTDATKALTGVYATDTLYNTKLNRIIADNNLTQYDSVITTPKTPETSEIPSTSVPSDNKETATPPAVSTDGTVNKYTVTKGDTLWKVAKANNISVDELKTLNGLTTNTIFVGQTLKLNDKVVVETSTIPSTSGSYTVVSGDTLWKVATDNNISVFNLKSYNNLTSDVIYVGQVLKLSASTTTPTPTLTPTPTPTPEVTAPTSTNYQTYTVVSGNTLWQVANANNISVANLKSLNNLTSDVIYVGQVLKIKAVSEKVVTTPTPTPTPTPEVTGTYTVKSGDTLWQVATNHNISVATLKSLNSLTSDLIYVGQVLKVTGTVTPAPTPTPTPTPVVATKTYTIKSGDTLWQVATNYGMTVYNLKALNSLTSDVIHVGQVLKVTGEAQTPKPTTPDTSTPVVTTPTAPTELSAKFVTPASGYMSSPFGNRPSVFGTGTEFHYGVDIAGSGAIVAAQSGTVVVAGWHNSYGNYTIIDHGTINGKNVKTLYAHQAKIQVSVGQKVSQGQQIGIMGTTGDSTGVHLHFEVRENDWVVQPLNYITIGGSTITTNGTYTVKTGDTLYRIALDHGVSLVSLLEANGISSSDIYVGQTIVIP